jgi:hypothetical protein
MSPRMGSKIRFIIGMIYGHPSFWAVCLYRVTIGMVGKKRTSVLERFKLLLLLSYISNVVQLIY